MYNICSPWSFPLCEGDPATYSAIERSVSWKVGAVDMGSIPDNFTLKCFPSNETPNKDLVSMYDDILPFGVVT